MKLMEGKTGLVAGVANRNSIAWSIAQRLAAEGARVVFSYQGERLRGRVEALVGELEGDHLLLPCDATSDQEIDILFREIESQCGGLDFLVHSIAFANKEDIAGHFVNTSREGFRLAHDVSAYTLVGLARGAAPLMERNGGGSIIALTYLGSERVVPNYNVMGVAKASLEASVRYLAADLGPRGIRVNALSPGPISTLAARGIAGFSEMLKAVADRAPMRRNTDPAEVADASLFLLSDMGRGITGELIHIDGGFHIVGM
ncbi:enoyl-ACP reductase [Candidatus Sumerlaeota bacterium]|nr:enoyl-ACP reductase [Candidatus Sumerlaeota bacterium]